MLTLSRDDEYGDIDSIEDPFAEKQDKTAQKKPAPDTVKRVRKENVDDSDPEDAPEKNNIPLSQSNHFEAFLPQFFILRVFID